MKAEFDGTGVFQLDVAENGEVWSEAIIPVPLFGLLIDADRTGLIEQATHAVSWKRVADCYGRDTIRDHLE